MTQKLLTHWKKLTNPDYLGAYDFQPGEERILTIKDVRRQMVRGVDGKQDECTVAHFFENCKPMILNVTNSKTISLITESPYIEMWINAKIKIYVAKIKVKSEFMDALRIKPQKITLQQEKQKINIEIGDENFNKCRIAYLNDSNNIHRIKKNYSFSEETLHALTTIDTPNIQPAEANNETV